MAYDAPTGVAGNVYARMVAAIAPPRRHAGNRLPSSITPRRPQRQQAIRASAGLPILINGDPNGPKFDMLMYLPKAAKGRSPTILGMNFYGNHAVSSDSSIRMEPTAQQGQNPCPGSDGKPEPCRGSNAAQWPLDEMLDKGYAVATFSRLDIDPDTKDGFAKSLKSFYPELQNRPDNFSTIGEWAWAFSRAMDYLETDRAIDAKKVAIFGWSRLGKATLWAGASDEQLRRSNQQ